MRTQGYQPRRGGSFARFCTAVLLAITAGSVTSTASSQETRTLMIKIVDQTGALLPNATVVVTHGRQRQTLDRTATPGVFLYGPLQPDTYTVTAEATGFATATRTATVRALGITELTIELQLRIVQQLSVIGALGRNSLTGLTFAGKDLDQLPNSEVELLNYLLDLAGSRGRPGDVAIYVDGFRDFRRLPPRSAIEMIRVNAEPYSAEFSEPGTRRIEIITKPGADEQYLEVKGDFNDESLNATEALGNSKPPLQRRTISGYYMAPIMRDRWGAYAYAGRWEQDEHAVIRANVLDDSGRPAEFHQTVAAPLRIHNFTANTTFAAGPRLRLKAEFSRDTLDADNQGFQLGGSNLPERALRNHNAANIGRLSMMTMLGEQTLYEMRVQVRDDRQHTAAVTRDPAIVVFDAFTAGGNQPALLKDTRLDARQIDTKLTRAFGSLTFHSGLQIDRHARTLRDEADFGGTFTFGADIERDATGAPVIDVVDGGFRLRPIAPLENYRRILAGAPGTAPTLFSITRGDPVSQLTQWEAAAYAQANWQRFSNLTLSFGLRYEAQTHLTDRLNFAPRFGMAWSVGGGSGMLRAGAGVFHDRFELELTDDTIRLDGRHLQRYVVERPTFFPAIRIPDFASPDLQTIMTKADQMKAPELRIANASYERDLFSLFGAPLFGAVTYTAEAGRLLTRLRDLNAPLTVGAVRPVTGVGQVLQYESTGRSMRHELQLALRASLGAGSRVTANYTLASTKSDIDTARTIPNDSYNLGTEYGAALVDARHRVFVSGIIMLPRLWLLVPSVTAESARPFNVTIGLDHNGDSHLTDRPSFADAADADAINTRFGLLDPTPEPGDTIIPRNFGRGFPVYRVDLALAKVFALGDPALNQSIAFNLAVQNLLNKTGQLYFDGVLLSPRFGRTNTAHPSRRVSLGATLSF